jgi:hypothetical protein
LVYIGLINFFDRLIAIIKTFTDERLSKNTGSIISAFEKIISKFELKNLEKKVTDMKGKLDS